MGLGLEKVGLVGGELFKGPAFSVSKARAPEVSSTGKEREERGDEDLFGGASREVSLSKTVGWWIGQRLLMKLCWRRCPGTTILLHSLWGFGFFPFLFLLLVLARPWW